jgi:hypothetical protein
MALPVSGDSISGLYQYTVDLNQDVGTAVGVTALMLDASNVTATFGTDASNDLTVTINGATQVLTSIGDYQSPSAFTYASGGTTYLLSNGPVAPSNVADLTVGNLTALVGGLGDVGLTQGANDYVACYLAGTLILTDRGEIPVETLSIGDFVVTGSGALRPIKWIGMRRYDGDSFARRSIGIMPIRIQRGALADNVPRRDLYVSPRHALFIDGALFPAGYLVNGTSICAIESIESIQYFHVELDSHDVILAEGAAAETFVDDNSRAMFHNADDYRMRYPDAAAGGLASYYAPRIERGYRLEALAQRLAMRGRLLQADGTATALGPLLGSFDRLTPGMIVGWARNAHVPEHPVDVVILDNGVVIAEVSAQDFRPDLQAAGLGDGRHGFSVTIPAQLSGFSQHVIRILRQADGAELPGSPMTLEPTIVPRYRKAA